MTNYKETKSLNYKGTLTERVAKLQELIKNNKTVFFGGAGVSTASGIPDFRSSNGLYNQKNKYNKNPEYLLSDSCFNHEPKIFYEFYKNNFDVRKYEPNEVHKKLAEMEDRGYLNGIITQNVDCLHQKAGNKNVAEIHGTISENYCIKCKENYDINFIFDSKDIIPRCPKCGKNMGFVRPKVVLYGEQLLSEEMKKALCYIVGDNKNIQPANLMIVGGTSLKVSPANTFVRNYFGKYLVIMNREETDYDQYADIVFREDINEVFKLLKF